MDTKEKKRPYFPHLFGDEVGELNIFMGLFLAGVGVLCGVIAGLFGDWSEFTTFSIMGVFALLLMVAIEILRWIWHIILTKGGKTPLPPRDDTHINWDGYDSYNRY